jgi:hypothetical protein
MVRAVKIVILLVWLVMTGMLIHRSYLRPAPVIALDAAMQEGVRPGDEWFGIFQQGRKIGYAHTSIAAEGDAYRLSEDSEMDILAMGRVQRVATSVNAYTTRAFLLKYFDFSLRSDASSMDVKGAVVKNQLVVDIVTAGETRTMRLPLSGPVYLTPHVRPAVVLLGLEPGRRYRFPLFNPATLSTDDAFVTVEAKDTIKVGDADLTVYRLKETFQGMEATAWITPDGATIKEESPLGYMLLRESREEALRRDKAGPVVDIVNLVRIDAEPIANSGQVRYLRARLGNAPFEGFELAGGRQSWSGGIVEVRAEQELADLPLPVAAAGLKDALRPTALVQSDDRGIRDQASRIVGRERSAREAARKLNAWVYEAVAKQPVVSIPSAVEVLRQKVGDCNEHTILYTALARAAGVPTRMAAGIVYLRNGFYYHAWPEVWLGDWVAVDPTFNQFPADATHIRFMTGELDRQVEIVKLVGKLKVEVLEYK